MGIGEMVRNLELIQHTTVTQLSDLFLKSGSIMSTPPKTLRLKASNEQQEILRIHGKNHFNNEFFLVASVRKLVSKKKPTEILAKLSLVGNHNWFCEGKTKVQPLNEGVCAWNECIEL